MRRFRSILITALLSALTVLGVAACTSEPAKGDTASHFLLRVQAAGSDEKWKIPAIKGRGQSVTDDGGGDLTITVVDVGEDTAGIRLDQPVTPADGPGNEPRTEFTVKKGEPASFISPTGTTWTVSYEEISVE